MVEMLDARAFVPFTRQLQQHETDATGLTLYMPARQNSPVAALENHGKPPGLEPGSNRVFAA
jgi:hypothetical protein